MNEKTYSIRDLLYLMSRLRDPQSGCPWDIKQSFETIAPCTIEEAYEVVDAIEQNDHSHLEEELGDLLFQVVFYGQLGEEQKNFNFDSIVHTLTAKLIRRHPHVFPTGTLRDDHKVTDTNLTAEDVKQNWENIKKQERDNKGQGSLLDGVAIGLPALTRAGKLQKRAAKVGFDWQNVQQILAKLREEVDELEQELEADSGSEKTLDELGDVFFTAVNLARFLKADPESVVRRANQKFEKRFNYIEQKADNNVSQLTTEQMNILWEQSKTIH